MVPRVQDGSSLFPGYSTLIIPLQFHARATPGESTSTNINTIKDGYVDFEVTSLVSISLGFGFPSLLIRCFLV